MNFGFKIAQYDFICVLDADTLLLKNALKNALKNFNKYSFLIAVSGKIKVNKPKLLLQKIQYYEYQKIFNIVRPVLNKLNANFIISGAFGIFKKKEIILLNGYDVNTVGEDLELTLRINKKYLNRGRCIVYDTSAVCLTKTPKTLFTLLKQRDRWQRGLTESILKHYKMIFNRNYKVLGLIIIPIEIVLELIGPLVLFILNIIYLIANGIALRLSLNLIIFLLFEFILNLIADFLEHKSVIRLIIRIPKLLIYTILGILLNAILVIPRIFGMMTFKLRKNKW